MYDVISLLMPILYIIFMKVMCTKRFLQFNSPKNNVFDILFRMGCQEALYLKIHHARWQVYFKNLWLIFLSRSINSILLFNFASQLSCRNIYFQLMSVIATAEFHKRL